MNIWTHHPSSYVLGKTDPLVPRVVAVLWWDEKEKKITIKYHSFDAVHESCGLNTSHTHMHALSPHHFLDDLPQSASFDVLCNEVEPLVLIQDSNELEHIGVIQATHDLHLIKQKQVVVFTSETVVQFIMWILFWADFRILAALFSGYEEWHTTLNA